MSAKELNRLKILGRVLEGRLTQAQVARHFCLCVRRVETAKASAIEPVCWCGDGC